MTSELTTSTLVSTLDWVYESALNGLPGTDSAQELAESYMDNDNDIRDNVDSLIVWQMSKAGTSGFLTGMGGFLTMPITLPLNITSIMYIQVRLIAAIAYMNGIDIKNDKVKTLVLACLTGSAITDVFKEVGMEISTKAMTQLIHKIPGATIKEINKVVGFKLLTKFGERGAVNLVKFIPFASGIIGGGIDAAATRKIGNMAKKVFSS